MKKFLDSKETGKRKSKTNLTRGAFGTQKNNGFKIIKVKDLSKIPLATPKGKVNSTYMKYVAPKHSKKVKPTLKKD